MAKIVVANTTSLSKFAKNVGKPHFVSHTDTPDIDTIAAAKLKSERQLLDTLEKRKAFDAEHGITHPKAVRKAGMTRTAFEKLGGKSIAAVGLPKKPDEWAPENEVKPDVPELGAGGRKAATKYNQKPSEKKLTDRTNFVCADDGAPISSHLKGKQGLIHPGTNVHQTKIGGRGDTRSTTSHADERGPRTPAQSPQFLSHASRAGRGTSVKHANVHDPKNEEFIMNTDKIVNDIIREAFTSGDRNNTTPSTNGMSDRGGTARQMLAGELFGSVAWPYDQSTSSDYEGSAKLQATQAENGLGELNTSTPSYMESVSLGKEIVDNLLEDCPGAEYTNPESIAYLAEALKDSGYPEFAQTCDSICENALGRIPEVKEMIEKLTADKADSFLIEQLGKLEALLTENEMGEPSEKSDTDEDPTSSPDTGLEA